MCLSSADTTAGWLVTRLVLMGGLEQGLHCGLWCAQRGRQVALMCGSFSGGAWLELGGQASGWRACCIGCALSLVLQIPCPELVNLYKPLAQSPTHENIHQTQLARGWRP